jgi:hypothetical protein
MSVAVWAMIGIAFWHLAVLMPARFWGGIVGAFRRLGGGRARKRLPPARSRGTDGEPARARRGALGDPRRGRRAPRKLPLRRPAGRAPGHRARLTQVLDSNRWPEPVPLGVDRETRLASSRSSRARWPSPLGARGVELVVEAE